MSGIPNSQSPRFVSAQHTPGPWKIDVGHQTKRARGISADKRNIVNFGGLASPASEETAANARLIAAAPDLLAALDRTRSLLAVAEGHFAPEFNARVRTAVAEARIAIAKAAGAAS